MNFNTHLEGYRQAILRALNNNKPQLIDEFIIILKNSSSLLRTDSFDFWVNILQHTHYSEIPITKHGVTDASKSWQQYSPAITTFENRLLSTCEKLFTYWQYDDVDKMQGQFYFYIDTTTKQVFKQSEFGMIKYLDNSVNNFTNIHFNIALVSDLSNVIKVSDLY